PNASTVNPSTAIAANFWSTGVPTTGDNKGTIAVFSTNQLDVILDVVGFYSPSNPAGVGNLKFINPTRVLDTRNEAGGPIGVNADGSAVTAGQIQTSQTRTFRISGQTFAGFAFPSDVSGIIAHVTIAQPSAGGGYVVVFPRDQSAPNASTVNPSSPISFNSWATGIPTTGSSAGTFGVFSTNQLDVIVDVMGFWAPSNPNSVGNLQFINPTRVGDTRPETGGIGFNPDGTAITPRPIPPGTTPPFLLNGKTFTGIPLPTDS